METPVVIELTEDEAEFLVYLVRKECRREVLADMEASIVESLLRKLR
ncbi:hypothetical protein AhSzq1_88 [Aeromonas phage AhSzq-1]|uniref:Uncharacterized protein n=1 Tax=Aeromonas phage AhSzq-1 TaxID=2138298 RepID=A0A2R4ALR0_9CAUD|nr:hypothetical protein HOT03_gp088 [Aeromonas phage AhSzq-1]AVR75981.1 hypothetical protein AhSzq1_88 [Aeromonas phage AhSzq-1]